MLCGESQTPHSAGSGALPRVGSASKVRVIDTENPGPGIQEPGFSVFGEQRAQPIQPWMTPIPKYSTKAAETRYISGWTSFARPWTTRMKVKETKPAPMPSAME